MLTPCGSAYMKYIRFGAVVEFDRLTTDLADLGWAFAAAAASSVSAEPSGCPSAPSSGLPTA